MDDNLLDFLCLFDKPTRENINILRNRLLSHKNFDVPNRKTLTLARWIDDLANEKIDELSGLKINDITVANHGILAVKKIGSSPLS